MTSSNNNLWKTFLKGEQPKKSKGVGDTIAKITKAIGFKQCGGCKKRQKKLNALFPYKQKK